MATSFSNLKKGLGLLDFITFGKYKACRVDSIIEMDIDYLMYMIKSNPASFTKEVVDEITHQLLTRHGAEVAKENSYWEYDNEQAFDDVPF
jgi:hypothetical protein